ncbi:DUF1540 domain-containing protein [Clostridium culturomicium]|uniref:DUF1540 domain-containing protein n=1 Tax=Clostridium culturomicium TaxID=1499683 RepID=UPI00058CB420|nr:DUF1540 domain-containing protein [Clostridium culturomicium]
MSGNLNCNAKNCMHNTYGMCTSNNIHIQGTNAHSKEYTNCGSFEEKGLKHTLSNVHNYNIGGVVDNRFTNSAYSNSSSIQCEAARCRYNINGSCTSGDVNINGPGAISNNRTDCESFML